MKMCTLQDIASTKESNTIPVTSGMMDAPTTASVLKMQLGPTHALRGSVQFAVKLRGDVCSPLLITQMMNRNKAPSSFHIQYTKSPK